MLNFIYRAKNYKYNNIFFIGLIIELLYLILFSVEPLKKVLHDNHTALNDSSIFLLVISILSIQILLYVLAGRQIEDEHGLKSVLFFFCLFTLTLVFIWPIASTDFFTYINQARIFSHFNANPYFISYQSLSGDQFYYLISNGWSSLTSLYGPFINLFNSALTYLSGNNFILTFLLFKTTGALFNAANGLLIYKITGSVRSTFFYLWNPFILFELIVNGHNEAVVIFFILLSVYLLKTAKKFLWLNSLSMLALFFTVLAKAYTFVLLPVFALIQLKYLPNIKQRIYFITSSLLMMGLFSFIFYFPFWQGIETLSRPFVHANYNYGTFFSSIAVMAFAAIFYFSNLANYTELGYLFGRLSFVFFYLTLIYVIITNKLKNEAYEDIIKNLLICIIIFYATFFNWLMPWYYTILITLIILYHKINNKPMSEYAIYGLSFFGVFYYFVLR